MRQPVLRIRLLQLAARDHDGDGGLGDEVVGEGAEEDAGYLKEWLEGWGTMDGGYTKEGELTP